jgi:Fe-S cluster assembly protein SufD
LRRPPLPAGRFVFCLFMSALADVATPAATHLWRDLAARVVPAPWDDIRVPEWLTARQAEARATFADLPAPRRQDEHWRFADLKKLDYAAQVVAAVPFTAAETTAAVTRSVGLAQPAARLVLGNDRVLHLDAPQIPGLIVKPLADALTTHGELIRQHFMAQPASLGGEKLQALHLAALRGGVFIYLAPGTVVTAPIEVHQWLGGMNAALFPHVLVIAGKGAQGTVVDYFQSLTSEPGFACGVTDLAASENAQLTYVSCQRWSRKVHSFHFSSTTTARDATVKSCAIELGAAHSRKESLCLAQGAGSRSEMLSLAVAEGLQEMDGRTRQVHRQPHTFSDLVFKNVLFDQARTVFSGLIYVEEGAHFTDAYQTCRNLVLSEEAEANAMPGLEINADQVKCSHGSTSGPLREEEIYYLRSRGIREDTARQLLAAGFCHEVIDRIGHPELESAMRSVIEEKFRRMQRA